MPTPNSANPTVLADAFQTNITLQTEKFAEICSKYFSSMLFFDCQPLPGEFLAHGIQTKNNVVISVLFTGTVFGEYVLALDEELAAKIIGQTFVGKNALERSAICQEIIETFSELLNLIVGESIVNLADIHKKLTITSPKVIFGSVKYPLVKTGRVNINSEFGPLECFLFVDRMKLDISDSYKEALTSLESANGELRNAMVKLQDQQEHLIQSEKLAALGTMAAGVAHEINTPLATISIAEGNLKELLENSANFDKKEFAKMLNIIDQTIFRIAKITNALRDYAKSSSIVSLQSVSARHVLNEALIFCQTHIQDKGVELITTGVPETILLDCRSQQISQVLFNLLTNSADAIEHSTGKKWIKVEASETADIVELKITDSGIGINAEVQKKLFDPFFTTKMIGKGAGLGLSISKGILDLHKGKLFFNSQSSNTQFIVQIPKKMPAAVVPSKAG